MTLPYPKDETLTLEIYPSDIPVAKILSYTKEQDKLTQNVVVEILSKINELNYVFVIQ